MPPPPLLVTGGAGYIGSHVAWAAADAGYELVVLDDLSTGRADNLPTGAELIEGDVGDRDLVDRILKQHQPAAVLHFAGKIVVPESVERPLHYYRENVVATLGVIESMVAHGVPAILFSSTAAVYAPRDDGAPLGEEAMKAPESPYGQSKLMSEAMIRDAGMAHGLSAAVLRYFNVAGADPAGRTGQSTPNATHLLKVASQVAIGLREKLAVFGEDYPTPDGTCVRDYIHVSDLASAHLLALEHVMKTPGQLTLNCGYGRGASVKEVVAAVEKVQGAPLPHEVTDRRPGDPHTLIADPARIFETLDWTPRHDSMEEMVRSAIAWEKALQTKNR